MPIAAKSKPLVSRPTFGVGGTLDDLHDPFHDRTPCHLPRLVRAAHVFSRSYGNDTADLLPGPYQLTLVDGDGCRVVGQETSVLN